MLGGGFKAPECKTQLRMVTSRITVLKRQHQIKQRRLVSTGRDSTARIQEEHVVREQNIMDAYDIIQVYCVCITDRFCSIESQKACPTDLKPAVSSLIYASSRCDDLPELLQIRALFTRKYGKEFVAAAAELHPECGVNREIIEKLHVGAPQEETNVNKFNKLRTKLKTKAKTHLKCWTDISAKSERKLDWRMLQTGPLHYFGRRLECQNTASSYLTPDFFPRLQGHFQNYFLEQEWQENHGNAMDRNLICFTQNGNEVFVEYCDIHFFVDVLVRSSQPYMKAVKFIDTHVIRQIQHFCASPEGGQGVLLVEAVIRKVCVEKLYVCKDRKVHSVLVSTLKEKVRRDPHHKHTWSHRVPYEDDTEFARDLLDGEGAHSKLVGDGSSSGHSSSSHSSSSHSSSSHSSSANNSAHCEQYPRFFYPSIENVSMLERLNIRLNLGKSKMPMKLHLMCDHKDGRHVVENQPGRTIQLSRKGDGYDVPIMKLAVTLFWAGAVVATSIAGVSVGATSQVDNWIQNLFVVPEMPDIDGETLHQMMNLGKTSKPVSEQDILKALERYWEIDPHHQGLKLILNLQDRTLFWNDFQLRKVMYVEAPHQIGWVCERHYWSGLGKEILRSV